MLEELGCEPIKLGQSLSEPAGPLSHRPAAQQPFLPPIFLSVSIAEN